MKSTLGMMMMLLLGFLFITGTRASGEEEEERRAPTCPKPFEPTRCLGTSGTPGVPPKKQKEEKKGGEKGGEDCHGQEKEEEREKIVWEAGMKGHSHYKIVPEKTAVLVIDPQLVYGNCPKDLTIEGLIAPPPSKKEEKEEKEGGEEEEEEEEEFDMHSPLCCEKFGEVVENINRITRAVREGGGHVVHVGHVYRDLDGDGVVDNDKDHGITGFDVLGWAGWPLAYNLWNENFPWASHSPQIEVKNTDFYTEKSTYSAMTDVLTAKLEELGVDTVIVSGFMTQFCVTTTARAAHDYGVRVVVVGDGVDGPKLLELISGVDENFVIPLYLSIAVADVVDTEHVVKSFEKN